MCEFFPIALIVWGIIAFVGGIIATVVVVNKTL